MKSRKKHLIFYLILFGILFSILEGFSYYVTTNFFITRGLAYSAPIIEKMEYDKYMSKRDPELGWLVAKNQEQEIDAEGSRLIPSFPYTDSSTSCVSLYGDSYTFSNRTTPEEAWSNQLSLLLNCRVSNFGVSGYGSGQALMRYIKNADDSAHVVLLNHFVDDIPRNVSQHWGTRYSIIGQAFMFKPRYILNASNELEVVPLPTFTFEEILELQKDPKQYLKHDYFVPGGDYGSSYLGFPYTFSLLRTLLFHSKFKTLFKGIPTHSPYYEIDHPSKSLQLTAEIMKEFNVVAKKRNQVPIVTIIPFSSDFDYYRETGSWCYQNLLDILSENDIEVINLGAEIEKDLKGTDQSHLYAGEGHFNANGDKAISKIIYDHLNSKDIQ